jgi:dihydroorotate dehydrogenase
MLKNYFVVNVSSPNTRGLRDLQDKEPLKVILGKLMLKNKAKVKPKPILLKIAPDLSDAELDAIAAEVRTANAPRVLVLVDTAGARVVPFAASPDRWLSSGPPGSPAIRRLVPKPQRTEDDMTYALLWIPAGAVAAAKGW